MEFRHKSWYVRRKISLNKKKKTFDLGDELKKNWRAGRCAWVSAVNYPHDAQQSQPVATGTTTRRRRHWPTSPGYLQTITDCTKSTDQLAARRSIAQLPRCSSNEATMKNKSPCETSLGKEREGLAPQWAENRSRHSEPRGCPKHQESKTAKRHTEVGCLCCYLVAQGSFITWGVQWGGVVARSQSAHCNNQQLQAC